MKVPFDATKWFNKEYPEGAKLVFRDLPSYEIFSVGRNEGGDHNHKIVLNYKPGSFASLGSGFRQENGRYSLGEQSLDLMVELPPPPPPLEGEYWAFVQHNEKPSQFFGYNINSKPLITEAQRNIGWTPAQVQTH